MAEKNQGDKRLVKFLIVFLVFPIAFFVSSLLISLPFGLILGVVVSSKKALSWTINIIRIVSGMVGGIWLCWLIWPKTDEHMHLSKQ